MGVWIGDALGGVPTPSGDTMGEVLGVAGEEGGKGGSDGGTTRAAGEVACAGLVGCAAAWARRTQRS